MIKRLGTLFWITIVSFNCLPCHADSIFVKRTNEAKPVLIAQDVIIRSESKEQNGQISYVSYFYWHPRKQLLFEGYLSQQEGKEISVEHSNPEAKAAILKSILEKGLRATASDVKGATYDLYCLKADYSSQTGISVIGGCPEADNKLRLKMGNNNKEFILPEIKSVSYTGKEDEVEVTTTAGKTFKGQWVGHNYPCNEVLLRGIDIHGEEVTVNLVDLAKLIILPRTK